MTSARAVLFDFSGTLFRLEENDADQHAESLYDRVIDRTD
jgi:hypothetical protein